MAKQVIAQQNQTWDILAKLYLDFEYFAKDIMLLNMEYADTVIFDGGEVIVIPDFENDVSSSGEIEDDTWS